MTDMDLWSTNDAALWSAALARYPTVIAAQGVNALPAHDSWYHSELSAAMRARNPAFMNHAELVRVTEWKMARGVWRARNLVLVKGNDEAEVEAVTAAAIGLVPHPSAPIAKVAELKGVGPATASAVLAAWAPALYPFLDEQVAAQVPQLGPVSFTMGYYKRYAEALRERARTLSNGVDEIGSGQPGAWTAADVEHALWANSGGKAGAKAES